MIRKFISLMFIILFVAGCTRSSVEKSIPVDTSELDRLTWHDNSQKPFVESVKQFYSALQNKNWEKIYEFRTNDFKEMIKLPVFLKTANDSNKSWSLRGYEILSIVTHTVQEQDPVLVRLIMKFQEDNITTYNVVWWIKEENKWHCLEPGPVGPSGLSIFFADGRIGDYLLKQFKKYD